MGRYDKCYKCGDEVKFISTIVNRARGIVGISGVVTKKINDTDSRSGHYAVKTHEGVIESCSSEFILDFNSIKKVNL